MLTPVSILIIAADPLARAALASLAESEGVDIIGRIAPPDSDEFNDLFNPDVIVWDGGWQQELVLPDLRDWQVPVLLLVDDGESANEAYYAGAKGILKRDVSAETLYNAIGSLVHDLIVIDPDMLPNTLQVTGPIPQLQPLIEPLTPRERDVLNLMAQGKTNRAIAFELEISDHTVKFHLNSVLTKLGAQSRTEAAVKAARMGLLAL